jgi:hypothetical protein
MSNRPLVVSIPPCESAREAAVRLPARLRVNVTPRAICRGAEGLYGVTQRMKGWIAPRAVKTEVGMEIGRAERKGAKTEGVAACKELVQCKYIYAAQEPVLTRG